MTLVIFDCESNSQVKRLNKEVIMGLGWRSGGCSSRCYSRSSRSSKSSVSSSSIVETPKVETPKVETPKVEAPKVEAPKLEMPKIPRAKAKDVMVIGGSLDATKALLSAEQVEGLANLFVAEKLTTYWCGFSQGLAGSLVEQILSKGGKAKAVLIEGDHPPIVPTKASTFSTEDVFARSKYLFQNTKAAVVLPGGYGTLSELTDLIAHRSAGLYNGAIVVYDPNGYFQKYFEFLGELYTHKAGVYPKGLYIVVNNFDDLKKHLGIKSKSI
jgi:predicted Rossmann-fold nucleotide-binding protein